MSELFAIEKRLDWEVTKRCNLHCSHCISRSYYPLVNPELNTAGAKRVIDRCVESAINYIHFFGGEPTERDDFPELLSYCDQRRISTAFTTSGTHCTSDHLQSLRELKHLRQIFISFEDIRRTYQNAIRGDGVYETACSAVEAYATLSSVRTRISFTLTRTAIEDLQPSRILEFFANLGAQSVSCQDLVIAPEASDRWKSLAYGPDEWFPFVHALFDPTLSPPLPFFYEVKPLVASYLNTTIGSEIPITYYGCNALGTEYRLLPDGSLLPCSAAVGWRNQLSEYIQSPETMIDVPLESLLTAKPYSQFLRTKDLRGTPCMEPCSECRFAYTHCNPCIFGRLTCEKHSVVTCAWVAQRQL